MGKNWWRTTGIEASFLRLRSPLKRAFGALILALCMAVCGSRVLAHHSNSMFDRDHQTELKGVVTDFQLINPHSEILFEVKDHHGNIQKWNAEGPSPSQMAENGWQMTAATRKLKILLREQEAEEAI